MAAIINFKRGFMEQETQQSPASTWSRQITLHGEIDVESFPDRDMQYPLKTEQLKTLPPNFKEAHVIEMKLFHSIVAYLAKHRPNRNMPVTRSEYMKWGADPKIVEQLVEFGLLKKEMVRLKTGIRACFYYTDQGRALIREKLDPAYAITEYTDLALEQGETQDGRK
jgi:hypothetical protein